MNFSRLSTLYLWVCYGLILPALVFIGCMPAADRVVIEEPPTPIPTTVITDEIQAQLWRRVQAQRFAAQAEVELRREQRPTADLPLLLARESVLTTWAVDGYVTLEADHALRNVINAALAPPFAPSTASPLPLWPIFQAYYDTTANMAVALSPDSRILAVATVDDGIGAVNSVRLWDVINNQSLGKLTSVPLGAPITALSFSPAGDRLLVVLPYAATLLVDWYHDQQSVTIPLQPDGVWTGTFAPDGRTVVLGGNKNLVLVNAENGQVVRDFVGHTGAVLSIVFDRVGSRLLSTSQDQTLRLWDVQSGQALMKISNPQLHFANAVFDPAEKVIAASSNEGVVQLWDIATQKLEREFTGMDGKSVYLSHNGRYMLSGSTLIDFVTGKIVRRFVDKDGNGTFITQFAPDGESIVAAGHSYSIELWPPVERMLAYADALIQRDPPTLSDWEVRSYEIDDFIHERIEAPIDASLLVPYPTPIVTPTARPYPKLQELSPLSTPVQ